MRNLLPFLLLAMLGLTGCIEQPATPPPAMETRVALATPLPPPDLRCGVFVAPPGGGPGWARLCASPERGQAAAAALTTAASRRGGFQLARQDEVRCGIFAALNIKKPGSVGPIRVGNPNGPLLRALEPGVPPNTATCTGGTPVQITHVLNVGEETFFLTDDKKVIYWDGRGDIASFVTPSNGPATGGR